MNSKLLVFGISVVLTLMTVTTLQANAAPETISCSDNIIYKYQGPCPDSQGSSNNSNLPPTATTIAQTTKTTTYKDPQNRFTVLQPANWTATPQADRFETTLVKLEDFSTASGMSISIIPTTITDSQSFSQALSDRIAVEYTIFKPVNCNEYKISGHEACSFIVTKAELIRLRELVEGCLCQSYHILVGLVW